MKHRLTLSLIVGLALSMAALYLAFRNVPLGDLVVYLKSIEYLWVLPAVVIVLAGFLLRAFRWQLLLASERQIPFWRTYHPMMIGFMINCILPGRVGELARPLILRKGEKVAFTTGLATVAAERMFDAVVLFAFLGILMAVLRIDPEMEVVYAGYRLDRDLLMAAASGILRICLVIVAGVVAVSIDRVRRWIIRLVGFIPAVFFWTRESFRLKIERVVSTPLAAMIEHVATGFALVKNPKMVAVYVTLTVGVWGLSALSYYVMAMGSPGIELSFFELSAVMIIVCFFIALPSVPGFWGLWEAGGVFALSVFGVPAREAAGFTLANHAVQMLPVIAAGLLSAVFTGINIRRISHEIGSGGSSRKAG